MGGPGVDPHWNGTTAEASKWGAAQAADALAAMKKLTITYPVVWADIELPGIAAGARQRLEQRLLLALQRA